MKGRDVGKSAFLADQVSMHDAITTFLAIRTYYPCLLLVDQDVRKLVEDINRLCCRALLRENSPLPTCFDCQSCSLFTSH